MLRVSRYQMPGYTRPVCGGRIIHIGATGYRQCCEQPIQCYPEAVHSLIRLLADAEAAEYGTQQIVSGELAGDLIESLLRLSQFFCHQLAGLQLLEAMQ